MDTEKPSYEELERRLLQAESALRAIRSGTVDAVIGDNSTLVLRVKETEDALKESEERYRNLSLEFKALLDAIPDCLTLQDKNLTILWGNKSAADLLGVKPEELVGRCCLDLWAHSDKVTEDDCFIVKCFNTHKTENQTYTTIYGKIWDLRAVPIVNEVGEITKVIAVGRDITEHKKLEEQLRQAQKMEAVGQLAGGVAHDFNNILTAIIGYADLLLMKLPIDDPNRHSVEQILSASERATNLTHSLLAFSRKQIVNQAYLDLNDIILGFEKFLNRLLPENIEIRIILSKEQLTVFVDRGQVEQVIMNLVTNARDAMPNGGILTIQTGVEQLDEDFIRTYGYGNIGNYAIISINDTGIGMDKATLSRIFEPFFTTKELGKGTGLGLAMVYGIVKKHEGFINVYSELGKGSTFKIYLPLSKSSKTQAEQTKKISDKIITGNETILLAEDESMVRKLISEVLKNSGYNVIEAIDGADAVEKFAKHKDDIKLVILDGIMPKKSGKEAYEEIKIINSDILTVFISGYLEDFSNNINYKENVLFIQKPITPFDLLKKNKKIA